MDKEIKKSDIIKKLTKQINHKSNCFQKYMDEIIQYINTYMQKDTITLFKCVPYYEHLMGKLRKLSLTSGNTEVHVVYFLEHFEQYSVLHFSMPVSLDK